MFIDRHLRFCNSLGITASAASTDLIDLGAERRIGTGRPLYMVCVVTVAFTDASSNSTVTVTLESDSTSAFGSAATVLTLPVFAALSAIGTRRIVAIPVDTATEQYLRAYFTVANGDLTTGSFTCFLTEDVEAFQSYADDITVQ
jgi:hypothetical protein